MFTVDRILAISDVHGENRKLQVLLELAEYEPKRDLLVIAGDLFDRGEENLDMLQTCEKLRQYGAVLLKGNHEQFIQASILEMIHSDSWRTKPSESLYNWYTYNGGASMYHEIKDLSQEKLAEILTFIQQLALSFSISRFIFSHAGANTAKPIEENTEDETVWMKESFPYCPAYPNKILIFGHVPTWKLYPYNKKFKKGNAKIWYDKVNQDKIGIDCGSVVGGRLAALELPSYREFYV